MKRIVGLPSKNSKKGSPAPAKPSIDDVVKTADRRTEEIELKIAECDNQLRVINNQLRRAETETSKFNLRQRAKPILIRKKKLEEQAELNREKSFNLDSIASSLNSAQDASIISTCLKQQSKLLRKDLKKLDLDKIEDVRDELSDLIELSEDVNHVISKNYDVPESIDDDELNDQLELLGDEIVRDNDPSYIDAVINPSLGATPSSTGPTGVGPKTTDGQMQMVDEFGLPILGNNTNNANPVLPDAPGFTPSTSVSHKPVK